MINDKFNDADADAELIFFFLREGGLKLLRVRDSGEDMIP